MSGIITLADGNFQDADGAVLANGYLLFHLSQDAVVSTAGVTTQLGAASSYALLAYSGITNTGSTVVTGGNIGSFPTTSITGFPPGTLVAPAVVNNSGASAAQTALAAAIVYYQGLTPTLSGLSDLSVEGNGSTAATYTAGNYFSAGASSLSMPTGIILDAQGNSNAVFVFVAGSTINLASGQTVSLINGAQAANVIFVAGSSFTSITGSTVNGNILAAVSITLGGSLNGRALANTGAVTISAAINVTVPANALGPIQICAGATIKVLLDINGNIQASPPQYIWPNDVLAPAGTFYLVSGYTAAGQLVWGPNAQQVFSTPSPYNVGAWVPNAVSTAGISVPTYDIGIFLQGAYVASQLLILIPLERQVRFAVNFAPSVAACGIDPTGTVVFTINKNGSQVGTVSISPSGAATFASAGIVFNANDVLTVVAPSGLDATLENVGILLSGTVTGR